MLTKIELHNWKSFKDAILYIDPLSVVIGKNASGKSNILDALQFIQLLATGKTVSDAINSIRGGTDWLIRKDATDCKISATMEDEQTSTQYIYTISLFRKDKDYIISSESLKRIIRNRYELVIFETEYDYTSDLPATPVRVYAKQRGRQKRIMLSVATSVLSQMEHQKVVKDVDIAVNYSLNLLRNIFVLSPDPQKMHDFIPLSKELSSDGANVAGVLAGLADEERVRVEQKISTFVEKLPERDIQRVWTDKVGLFNSYAMLNCEEKWSETQSIALDSRGMSDGTLRFIAIAVALLTRPENSLLVVDEIDNGLHPSRAKQLVSMLKTLGHQRHIDILCTTHNPILVNTMGGGMIPFISFVKRNDVESYSEIKLLEDIPNLVKLLATGNVGELMAQNVL